MSWLVIAILSQSSISTFTLALFLLLSNFGASIAEVANDAVVAEAGKQLSSSRSCQMPSSGQLQSFVWMASSAGGVVGNLLGGVVIDRFSPPKMFLVFGLIVSLQFFITIAVRESSLNLPKNPSPEVGFGKQLSELKIALKKPEIAYSITWFAASYAMVPTLTGTMFYYQIESLKIESSVLGMSKVFGQAAMLLWSVVYNRYLKSVPSRKLISAIQGVIAVLMASDVLFVGGMYRSMGMPDSVYVVIFSGLLEVMFFIKILPFSVLVARFCPPGCEGSLMAFVMSAIAFAFIVSGYLGVGLASYVVGVTTNDFSGFPLALLIQALCTLLPLYWSSYIPDDDHGEKFKNE